ncbi:BMC domain-containing protein [Yokenella regensburgei]
MKQSLGLLEVSGLALAISCADVMAKAASITLIGMEKTNGSGWTVIKVTGDVASVQSAIITGAHFASARDGLVAQKVIARPAEGLLPAAPEAALIADTPTETMEEEAVTPTDTVADMHIIAGEPAPSLLLHNVGNQVTCNLCLDPACTRLKGEPRTLCLHSGQRGE